MQVMIPCSVVGQSGFFHFEMICKLGMVLYSAVFVGPQLSELGRCGENKNARASIQLSKGDSNPGSLDWEPRHSTAELPPQLLYEQLSHMDICHFVILECRHLANGCVLKCGCIGLMLFRNLSCLGTIICYINTIGIVPAYACYFCDALLQVMQPLANVHEPKWTPHVKRESDVAVHIIAELPCSSVGTSANCQKTHLMASCFSSITVQ